MSIRHSDLDLAVIGNCQIAALIDSRASIVWCCLPRPDGDPVLSGLLMSRTDDSARGIFSVDVHDFVRSEQRYLRNTAIVETLLHDGSGGTVRITDFCPRYRSRGRVFRPMSLVRIVEPAAGKPVVTFRLQPTADYGARCAPGRAGSHHLRYSATGIDYRVTTDVSLTALAEERPIVLDKAVTFLLGPDETVPEPVPTLARTFLEETRNYWQDWVRTLAIPVDWQAAVIRAAITLKLCTYEDTGAVLAALTTSIPESPGTERTWDYRYCWMRDSYFVIQALNRLGATRTMEGYLHYIAHIVSRADAGTLQPLYSISGDPRVEERVIATLDGYQGQGPVRVGNSAADQIQHDVYGSVILASTQHFFDERLVSRGDVRAFERLERLGERARALYQRPDAGPWELRGSTHLHTFSAAMSYAGCDRLSRIAGSLSRVDAARRWRTIADSMQDRILAGAWSSRRQSFVSTFDGEDIDATALLLPELGLIPASDPRYAKTLAVVERELRNGDWLFRYRSEDDFGTPATAFIVCAFWYVNALASIGQLEQARDIFTRLLERRTPLGLLSEDIDVATGTLWGNFPQTYSMVGIITSALRLSRTWEETL